MTYKIGEGLKLREHLEDCKKQEQKSEWMISESLDYSLEMFVYPVYLDNWDLDGEEYEEIENKVLSQAPGYCNIMNADQLVDVIENLAKQKPTYNEQELELAINHYSKHDVFVVLGRG